LGSFEHLRTAIFALLLGLGPRIIVFALAVAVVRYSAGAEKQERRRMYMEMLAHSFRSALLAGVSAQKTLYKYLTVPCSYRGKSERVK
jgi:hypothetical protein